MKHIIKYNDYFLFESISVKQIKEQYKNIPTRLFVDLIKCDPYTKFQKNPETGKYNITNLGKYGISMLNIYTNIDSNQEKERLIQEDLPKAKEYIELLYKYRNAVKVNYLDINNMSTLFDLAKKFMLSKDNVSVKILTDNLEKDIDYFLLLNGEKWFIFKPLTEKGASILGAGTQWCTAWGKYSTNSEYNERQTQFSYHNNQGPLFILINKEDNLDKYQFHFESKQFKDRYDREIKKEIFLNDNEEIKKYFFPSLYGLDGDIEQQFERIMLLDNKDISILINKIHGDYNKLAVALLSKDEEEVLKCYETIEGNEDRNLYDEIDNLYDDRIVFISKLSNDMDYLKSELDSLKDQKRNSSENVYSSVYDMSDDETFFDDLSKKVFKEYFNTNFNKEIFPNIGKISFEAFEERYFEKFREDEKIIDAIKEVISNSSEFEYEQECRAEIVKITKYIDFEYNSYKSYKSDKYNITIPIPTLLKYILTEKIDSIVKTKDFIQGYMDYYQIWATDDIYIPVKYNTDEVDYKNHIISNPIDTFFEKIYDKFDIKNLTPERIKERKDKLSIYNSTIEKYFNSNNTFHNKNLSIGINEFDDDSLLIDVSIHFNKTNKSYRGYITMEQLINYITHEDLYD